jgi:hypothetical protein
LRLGFIFNQYFTKEENIIKVLNDEVGEPMFFFGSKEVSKPNLLDKPITFPEGDIVAFSDSGVDAKKRYFTSKDIENIEGLNVVKAPQWLLDLSL